MVWFFHFCYHCCLLYSFWKFTVQIIFSQCCKKWKNAAKHVYRMLQNIEMLQNMRTKCCKTFVCQNVGTHWKQCCKACLPKMLQNILNDAAKHVHRMLQNIQTEQQTMLQLASLGYFLFCVWFLKYLFCFQLVYTNLTTPWCKAHQSDRKSRNESRRGRAEQNIKVPPCRKQLLSLLGEDLKIHFFLHQT